MDKITQTTNEEIINHTEELYDIIDDLRWKLSNAKEIIADLKSEKETKLEMVRPSEK